MRVDDVAEALRHLAAVGAGDETVHDDALGQGHARAHEHRGPDHRVEPDDVLAHDVHVRRPEAAEGVLRVGAPDAAHVVGEGVEPWVALLV